MKKLIAVLATMIGLAIEGNAQVLNEELQLCKNSGERIVLHRFTKSAGECHYYSNSSIGGGDCIGCTSNDTTTAQARFKINTANITTGDKIHLSCSGSIVKTITLTALENNPIVITRQPTHEYHERPACIGSNVFLLVDVTGTSPTYQWYKGNVGSGRAINGATKYMYLIRNTKVEDTGTYYVGVSNRCNSTVTYSSPAPVVVHPNSTPPRITKGLETTYAACRGNSITLSIEFAGTVSDYSCEWFFIDKNNIKWSPNPNHTSNNWTINSLGDEHVGTYSVLIKNNVCISESVMSFEATLTINEPIIINKQPENGSVCQGSSFIASVEATGTSPRFQWYKRGIGRDTIISNGTSTAYQIYPVRIADAGTYYVSISNSCTPSFNSLGAILTVNTPIVITRQPTQTLPICVGSDASLSVNVTGTSPTYQWYKGNVGSGSAINGATENQYVIRNTKMEDTGIYYIGVSNHCSSTVTYSSPVPIIINHDITFGAGTINTDKTEIYVGNTVAFSFNGSSNVGFRWDFKDDSTSTIQNPSHVFLKAGTYDVTLRLTSSANCETTLIKTIRVLDLRITEIAQDASRWKEGEAYPNPCSGVLTVSSAVKSLVNVFGKEMPVVSAGVNKIDVRGLAAGVYWLRFENGKVVKIIKR